AHPSRDQGTAPAPRRTTCRAGAEGAQSETARTPPRIFLQLIVALLDLPSQAAQGDSRDPFCRRPLQCPQVTARLLPFRPPETAPIPRGADALAALAEAAAHGKPAAIRTLVVSVTPTLLRAARGVLGVWHPEVEDVAQEAAMGLVTALPRYRRECSVLHFAGRIGVLTALATRRR